MPVVPVQFLLYPGVVAEKCADVLAYGQVVSKDVLATHRPLMIQSGHMLRYQMSSCE